MVTAVGDDGAAIDGTTWNAWHPMAAAEDLAAGSLTLTALDRAVRLSGTPTQPTATDIASDRALRTAAAHGYVWASFGAPPAPPFAIPDLAEPDRRTLHAGSVPVHVSAPRAIENFLDLGHFPFVHEGVLGAQPHTEVKEYDVRIDPETDAVEATGCRFFQPMAAASSLGGAEVAYTYRVPHPTCALLMKSSGRDPSRRDVIGLFIRPVAEERIVAHMMLSLIDDATPDAELRRFQRMIFSQDRPILEGQRPKRLPLDPRAETPIRADRTSVAYRAWLAQKGVNYGVIPAGEPLR